MGLGVYGGGIASVKWLFQHGAAVTVTDLKTEEELKGSLQKFTLEEKKHITFVLGKHRKSDFKTCDMVIVNPAVPRESEYLKIAKENGAEFENVASLFFRFLENPIIGITGTRGKSTTTSFIAQLLSKKYGKILPVGSVDVPLLEEFARLQKNPKAPTPVELSSWQLELLPHSGRAPHVAVITNLYADHLNRYRGIEDYAKAKANIFAHQTEEDFLILNADNDWKGFFLEQKPRGKVFFFSKKPLLKKYEGVFLSRAGNVRVRLDGKEQKLFAIDEFERKFGSHNVANLLAAMLAVKLFDPTLSITKKDIMGLKQAPFREETIFETRTVRVINDSTATSPDAVVSALSRFGKDVSKKNPLILITGGTDKKLDFSKLALKIEKCVSAENLILLDGSATKRLVEELEKNNLGKKPLQIFETLEECLSKAAALVEEYKHGIVIFSPGASSFEKFRNEYDRGEQFSALVKKYFKK